MRNNGFPDAMLTNLNSLHFPYHANHCINDGK